MFLKNKIKFTEIPKINESCLENHNWIKDPKLEDLKELDIWIGDHVKGFL
jgi:1-deoxy-D-xylulose 5-phosphate reductoisomerase